MLPIKNEQIHRSNLNKSWLRSWNIGNDFNSTEVLVYRQHQYIT